MRFRLLAVGTRMPDWVEQGVEEYNKRLPADFSLYLQEIPLARRSKNSSPGQLLHKEGETMLGQVQTSDWVVALDVKGRQFST
ncbi:MAG: 23S rRNA (pseudouridine(1915)-N(3))-methyltransferase RlmH, partial [Gammaproteobacteria bacterium]|nr:23S rRNA (pseudouridine(1915)-N(3))-methyltransferase RlmH [Gammaproteobacteria bacterium]